MPTTTSDQHALLQVSKALAIPQEHASLANWRESLSDTMSEEAVSEATSALRALWMKYANEHAQDSQHSWTLPSGKAVLQDEYGDPDLQFLEERLADCRACPPSHSSSHFVFRSGMACISSFLFLLRDWWKPSTERPLNCLTWGSYFETVFQLEVLQHGAFTAKLVTDQNEFLEAIASGQVQAAFIDPVAYDWEMDVLSFERFIEAWNSRPKDTAGIIVLDTTLAGDRFPVHEFLGRLENVALFCHLASGLKLDQEGLELANVGFSSLYIDKSSEPTLVHLDGKLRALRSVLRFGLSYPELCELDAEFFLQPGALGSYSGRVFANNAFLAQGINIDQGRIFAKVAHPCLGDSKALDWAVAPFVVFHLTDDSLLNQGLLMEIMCDECERNGIPFGIGASFGFRDHRFEVIVPNFGTQDGADSPRSLFKVAMGSNQGKSRDFLVKLLSKIAGFPDFQTLEASYRNRKTLTPVTQTNMPFKIFSDTIEQQLRLSAEELEQLDPSVKQVYEELPELLPPDERYWCSINCSHIGERVYLYRDLEFKVPDGVVMPDMTSAFMFDCLHQGLIDVRDKRVLLMGIGAGLEAVLAARLSPQSILSTDIHSPSLEASRANFEPHRSLYRSDVEFLVSDLFSEVEPAQTFQQILFHPPTVPLTFHSEPLTRNVFGGSDFAYRFLQELVSQGRLEPGGKVYFVLSPTSNIKNICSYAVRQGFIPKIEARRHWPQRPGLPDHCEHFLLAFQLDEGSRRGIQTVSEKDS